MSDDARVEELLSEAHYLNHGDVKVRLLEEAVKLSDSLNDTDRSFSARMQYTEATAFAGHNERMMTSFAWCLARYNEDEDYFEEYAWDLMWQFKWVVAGVTAFPHVSTQEFHRLLDQMKQMYQACGYGMRPIHYIHFIYCFESGNAAEAQRLLEVWPELPRDDLADCEACEADSLVSYYAGLDEPTKAIEAAKGILSGDKSCAEVPHVTYSTLLRCLAQLGRYDEADEYQAKDYRMVRRNSDYLLQIGEHMAYLAHRRNFPKAVSLLEIHLDWALQTYELNAKFYFIAAATHLLQQLDGETRKLKLTPNFEKFDASNQYNIASLAQWFQTERDEMANLFDKRNRNDHYGRRVVEMLAYDGI